MHVVLPGSQQQALTSKAVPAKILADKVDGQITPISAFDARDGAFVLPFLNLQDGDAFYHLPGSPQFTTTDDAKLGYVKHSNVVFRAVVQVPPAEKIVEVTTFKLHVKGLRRYQETGNKANDLSNQVLCIIDTELCSGQKPTNDDSNLSKEFWASTGAVMTSDSFSKIKMDDVLFTDTDGATVVTMPADDTASTKTEAGEGWYDMRELFGLQKLSNAELIKWIYANSTEYGNPGYRKFRFVIGNNLYIEGGDLVLQVVTNGVDPSLAEKVEDPAHGKADASAASQPVKTDALQGPAGKDGTNGTNGIDGKDGATGANGKDGLNGKDGTNGIDGKDGATGANGKDGLNGKDGTNGIDGKDGASGANGKDGLNGKDGTNGIDGKDGATGANGKDGATGANGKDGLNGTNGSDGQNGKDGKDGVDGKEGTSGTVTYVDVEIHLSDETLGFGFNSAQVAANKSDKVTQTAKLLLQYNEAIKNVTIVGQADKAGKQAYNQILSGERASAVKALLLQGGLDASKINAYGIGEVTKSTCGTAQTCAADRIVAIKLNLADLLSPIDRAAVKQKLNDGLAAIWNN